MLTCSRLEAGGSKLEAWLTAAYFFKFRASSLLPQAYICYAEREFFFCESGIQNKFGFIFLMEEHQRCGS
jgi:hypothetical protein